MCDNIKIVIGSWGSYNECKQMKIPRLRNVKLSSTNRIIFFWFAMDSTSSSCRSRSVGKITSIGAQTQQFFFAPNLRIIRKTISISLIVFCDSPPFNFCKTKSCTSFSVTAVRLPNAGCKCVSTIREYAANVDFFTNCLFSSFHKSAIWLMFFFVTIIVLPP